jgi:hypothetical protein
VTVWSNTGASAPVFFDVIYRKNLVAPFKDIQKAITSSDYYIPEVMSHVGGK